MWSSSRPATPLLGLGLLLLLLVCAGCMADRPADTDMPWSTPARWEGTLPLPGGYVDRYQ